MTRSDDIAIGPARKAEIPQIKTWFAETLAEHQARHPYGFATNTMEIWSILIDAAVRDGAKGGNSLLSARDGGGLAGYLFCELPKARGRKTRGSAQILAIYVRPDLRRRGVGTRLLAHARAQAEAGDWDNLAGTVWEGNAAGAALFRKAGFTPMTTTYRAGPIRPARAIRIPKRWKYRKWLGPLVLIAGAVVLWMVLFLRERMGG